MKSVQIRSFLWSLFSCIRTEYRNFLHKFSYSARVQENKDQKKLRIWTLFTQWLPWTKREKEIIGSKDFEQSVSFATLSIAMWIKSHENEVISIELNKTPSKLQFPHAWPRFSGDPLQFQMFWEIFNS